MSTLSADFQAIEPKEKTGFFSRLFQKVDDFFNDFNEAFDNKIINVMEAYQEWEENRNAASREAYYALLQKSPEHEAEIAAKFEASQAQIAEQEERHNARMRLYNGDYTTEELDDMKTELEALQIALEQELAAPNPDLEMHRKTLSEVAYDMAVLKENIGFIEYAHEKRAENPEWTVMQSLEDQLLQSVDMG